MARTIAKPGPPPSSCLTCRQRRKKCDRSKPCCETCLKDGYECLGYGGRKPCQDDPAPPLAALAKGVGPEDTTVTDSDYEPRPSVLGAALLYRAKEPVSPANSSFAPRDSSEDFDHLWPQEKNGLTLHLNPRKRQSSSARSFQIPWQSIPRSVDTTKLMREEHTIHTITGYHLQHIGPWYKTPLAQIRDSLIERLRGSKVMTRTMYLGTRLFQALIQDPGGPAVRECIGWIDKLEQRVTENSHMGGNTPVNNVADSLTVQLELAYLKFTSVDSISGYASLQTAVPRFLQLVAADPNLYMELPNGNLVVSFPRTLSAPQYELQRFVMYDIGIAFALGVPPLVEYGYDGCDSGFYGVERIPGIPIIFTETISRVNSWRTGPRITPLENWEELERQVLLWNPKPAELDKEDSATGNMSGLAVLEGWQHVVLIYLYMGMCGASSHDSRVQASVHRIIHLAETVANLPINIHMLTHCVVAGLAARLEKHRMIIHQMLLTFDDIRVWFIRGPQFSQVLYHLWRGVGEGGAPVTWDDYVRSRCAIIPI